jgi:hypothetical protein
MMLVDTLHTSTFSSLLSPFSLQPSNFTLHKDGGAVASYKIERRERPAGDWMLISLAMESEATLNNQERGKDWEYRIIAVNKAGEGMPSNTVAAVL